MRVELWRCSVKEAKSPGRTICCLAFAAILEKPRKEDSLVAKEDIEGDIERLEKKKEAGMLMTVPRCGAWNIKYLPSGFWISSLARQTHVPKQLSSK